MNKLNYTHVLPVQNALNRLAFGLLGMLLSAPSLQAAVEDPFVIAKGAHHRTWLRPHPTQLPGGQWRTNYSSFVELGSGLHKWDSQAEQWVETDTTISVLPNGSGAVAHGGAHTLAFAANLNTVGAITLHTPDGKVLASHVAGLAWFDGANGNSQLFGLVQDSVGELHGSDTIIYPDAFTGISAAVRYVNRKGGFEQDVILYEKPTIPEGFAPETTRLEVWTEFIGPEPTVAQSARAGMVDDTLDWGTMQTGPGQAFLIGAEQGSARATVVKRWVTQDNRKFLVEAVRYRSALPALNSLPGQQAAVQRPAKGDSLIANASRSDGSRAFPPPPKKSDAQAKFRRVKPTDAAQAGSKSVAAINRGFVIDYELLSSTSDFTFKGNTTYYVTNTFNLSGSTTFEGGTVVKFAKTNIARLNLNGNNIWATAQYRPAIFTAVDDHTVGENIGSGSLSGRYGGGNGYLNMLNPGSIENARFSYATTAIKFSTKDCTNRHMQFVHCDKAIYDDGDEASYMMILENVLYYDVTYIRDGRCNVNASHITVNDCGMFLTRGDEISGTLNNSIVADLDDWGIISPTLNNTYVGSAGTLFQTVGAGAHYLANESGYRNFGSSAFNSTRLNNELKTRTTYPPIAVGGLGWYSNSVTFAPQAQRDTDSPDAGYHYDPLDFVLSGIVLTNATFTFLPGTAIGTRSEDGLAFQMAANSKFISYGSPTNLNRMVRYSLVQEQANNNWTNIVPCLGVSSVGSGVSPVIRCQFTEFCVPASETYHYLGYINIIADIGLKDCQVYGGQLQSDQDTVKITNSLLHRVTATLQDNSGSVNAGNELRNNTLIGSVLTMVHFAADTWSFRDNLFVDTTISDLGTILGISSLDADFNGYTTNLTRLNTNTGTHDVLLATTYNQQGLLTVADTAHGRLFSRTYDIEDNLVSATDANGVTTTNQFDALQRRTAHGLSVTNSVEGFGWSPRGLLFYTNSVTRVTNSYDELGRKITEINGNGETNRFAYAPGGELLTLTDAKEQVTTWKYDLFGRVTNKADNLGTNVFVYTYDGNDRLTNRWTPGTNAAIGINTRYALDGNNNVTLVGYANQTNTMAYDALNRLTNMVDAVGTNRYAYSAAGLLESEDGPWDSDTVSYTYTTGRQRSALTLLQPSATAWQQSYAYDLARRLTNTTSPAGVFRYEYTTTAGTTPGRLVHKLTLGNGTYITNGYDGVARLMSTVLKDSTHGVLNVHEYQVNAGHQRTKQTRRDGDYVDYSYDAAGQLIGAFGKETNGANRLHEQLGYAYDAAGNLQRRTNNALVQAFTVDSLNQLSNVVRGTNFTLTGFTTGPVTNVAVNTIKASNYLDRTFAKENLALVDGNNTFTAIAQDNDGRADTNALTLYLPATNNFVYDLNGNLRTNGTRIFDYDDENQLTRITEPGAWRSDFVYDGHLRRRKQQDFTWNGATWSLTNEVRFIYDGNVPIQERDGFNLPLLTLTRGLDLGGARQRAGGIGGLLAFTDGAEQNTGGSNAHAYYHADGNGNITALTDGAQWIVGRYLYDPFGNMLTASGSKAALNRYRFSSKPTHELSGMYDYLRRWYAPGLQRWLNRDPIAEEGGLDLLGFVSNDAINRYDSIGLADIGPDSLACAHATEQAEAALALWRAEPSAENAALLLAAAERMKAACKAPPQKPERPRPPDPPKRPPTPPDPPKPPTPPDPPKQPPTPPDPPKPGWWQRACKGAAAGGQILINACKIVGGALGGALLMPGQGDPNWPNGPKGGGEV